MCNLPQWIAHEAPKLFPSLVESLCTCWASSHQNLYAYNRKWRPNDNSRLVYGRPHKNQITFMMIVFSPFIWVILWPECRLIKQENGTELIADYIIQISFILWGWSFPRTLYNNRECITLFFIYFFSLCPRIQWEDPDSQWSGPANRYCLCRIFTAYSSVPHHC